MRIYINNAPYNLWIIFVNKWKHSFSKGNCDRTRIVSVLSKPYLKQLRNSLGSLTIVQIMIQINIEREITFGYFKSKQKQRWMKALIALAKLRFPSSFCPSAHTSKWYWALKITKPQLGLRLEVLTNNNPSKLGQTTCVKTLYFLVMSWVMLYFFIFFILSIYYHVQT